MRKFVRVVQEVMKQMRRNTSHHETIRNDKVYRQMNQKIMKPDPIFDYISTYLMNKTDMQISAVECVCKSLKQNIKLSYNLVELLALNFYIL